MTDQRFTIEFAHGNTMHVKAGKRTMGVVLVSDDGAIRAAPYSDLTQSLRFDTLRAAFAHATSGGCTDD